MYATVILEEILIKPHSLMSHSSYNFKRGNIIIIIDNKKKFILEGDVTCRSIP